MLVDAPSASLVAEVGKHKRRRSERAVAVAERGVDAGIAECDDVGAAAPSKVGEHARMLVDAPAAGDVAEIREHESHESKRAVRLRFPKVRVGAAERDVRILRTG